MYITTFLINLPPGGRPGTSKGPLTRPTRTEPRRRGADLGRLLRTLSTFLREDARTRAELETRQGWTVNAARLALCAPWILLLLLSSQPDAVQAYNTAAGTLVLLIGGGVSLVAYRVMLRIARLPSERRVLG